MKKTAHLGTLFLKEPVCIHTESDCHYLGIEEIKNLVLSCVHSHVMFYPTESNLPWFIRAENGQFYAYSDTGDKRALIKFIEAELSQ